MYIRVIGDTDLHEAALDPAGKVIIDDQGYLTRCGRHLPKKRVRTSAQQGSIFDWRRCPDCRRLMAQKYRPC